MSSKNANGKTFTPPDGMVIIPAGTLNMGGDNEQADKNEFLKHQVQIAIFRA